MNTPSNYVTDKDLFASLPGGQAVIEWFGFCPSFHDADLEGVTFSEGKATLSIKAFRMTTETDERGVYILDRHALVTMQLRDVTGLKLSGDTRSIISELTVRRLRLTPSRSDWETCNGPVLGDIEVAFGTSIGLCGEIYAKELEFMLQPLATMATG